MVAAGEAEDETKGHMMQQKEEEMDGGLKRCLRHVERKREKLSQVKSSSSARGKSQLNTLTALVPSGGQIFPKDHC